MLRPSHGITLLRALADGASEDAVEPLIQSLASKVDQLDCPSFFNAVKLIKQSDASPLLVIDDLEQPVVLKSRGLKNSSDLASIGAQLALLDANNLLHSTGAAVLPSRVVRNDTHIFFLERFYPTKSLGEHFTSEAWRQFIVDRPDTAMQVANDITFETLRSSLKLMELDRFEENSALRDRIIIVDSHSENCVADDSPFDCEACVVKFIDLESAILASPQHLTTTPRQARQPYWGVWETEEQYPTLSAQIAKTAVLARDMFSIANTGELPKRDSLESTQCRQHPELKRLDKSLKAFIDLLINTVWEDESLLQLDEGALKTIAVEFRTLTHLMSTKSFRGAFKFNIWSKQTRSEVIAAAVQAVKSSAFNVTLHPSMIASNESSGPPLKRPKTELVAKKFYSRGMFGPPKGGPKRTTESETASFPIVVKGNTIFLICKSPHDADVAQEPLRMIARGRIGKRSWEQQIVLQSQDEPRSCSIFVSSGQIAVEFDTLIEAQLSNPPPVHNLLERKMLEIFQEHQPESEISLEDFVKRMRQKLEVYDKLIREDNIRSIPNLGELLAVAATLSISGATLSQYQLSRALQDKGLAAGSKATVSKLVEALTEEPN